MGVDIHSLTQFWKQSSPLAMSVPFNHRVQTPNPQKIGIYLDIQAFLLHVYEDLKNPRAFNGSMIFPTQESGLPPLGSWNRSPEFQVEFLRFTPFLGGQMNKRGEWDPGTLLRITKYLVSFLLKGLMVFSNHLFCALFCVFHSKEGWQFASFEILIKQSSDHVFRADLIECRRNWFN